MTNATVHVELVPSRREAVAVSGGRRGAGRGGREVRPGHGDGVVDVQVRQEGACARRCGTWGQECAIVRAVLFERIQ